MNTKINPPQLPTTPLLSPPMGSLEANKDWLAGNLTYEIANAYATTQIEHINYMYKTATDEEMDVRKNLEILKNIYAFANSFAEKLGQNMANLIFDYVKNMEITMNTNGSLTASMGPMSGPVVGKASTSLGNFTIN